MEITETADSKGVGSEVVFTVGSKIWRCKAHASKALLPRKKMDMDQGRKASLAHVELFRRKTPIQKDGFCLVQGIGQSTVAGVEAVQAQDESCYGR